MRLALCSKILAGVVLLSCMGSGQSFAQGRGRQTQASARSTVLAPGVCQSVSDGDLVTFEWNPAFEHPVAGLREVTLLFSAAGKESSTYRGYAGLKLYAQEDRGAESPFTALPNGFFQVRFHVSLQSAEPGEYRILHAQVVPQLRDNRDTAPAMTNSPVNSSYCLSVQTAKEN